MIRGLLFAGSGQRFRQHLRIMRACRRRGLERTARFVERRIQARFGCYVSRFADIAETVSFPHPTGIVIGEGVILRDRVKVYQNVTLGGARIGDWRAGNYPEVGERTVLFAGAVVAGRLRIGRDCVIGANSVVLSDIPDDCVAAGAPARVVRGAAPAQDLALKESQC